MSQPSSSEIAQQHQAQQAALVTAITTGVASAWALVDLKDLAGSLPKFAVALTALIHRFGLASGSLAVDYYRQQRQLAGIPGRPTVRVAPLPTVEEVTKQVEWATRSLWDSTVQTNPDAAQQVLDAVKTIIDGVAEKAVLDVSRDTVVEAVQQDRKAKAWARVPEPEACSFCALLSIRGAVYKSRTSGDFRSHDHCRCHVEPVFNAYEPSAQIREWQGIYARSTAGLSGKAARRAFRQALERQPALV